MVLSSYDNATVPHGCAAKTLIQLNEEPNYNISGGAGVTLPNGKQVLYSPGHAVAHCRASRFPLVNRDIRCDVLCTRGYLVP